MILKASKVAFHTTEALIFFLFGFLIQSQRNGFNVFLFNYYRPHVLHPSLAARDDPNAIKYFIPHPPHFFGLATFSHAT